MHYVTFGISGVIWEEYFPDGSCMRVGWNQIIKWWLQGKVEAIG